MVDKHHINFPSGVTCVTPFLIVFGTLRKGGGNYAKYLKDTKHIGTYKLHGWIAESIFSCYTGKEKDYIVVDVFDLRYTVDGTAITELELYELNYKLDNLEGVMRQGSYTTTFMYITVEDNAVPAKLYNAGMPLHASTKIQTDFLSKKYIDYPKLEVHEIPII